MANGKEAAKAEFATKESPDQRLAELFQKDGEIELLSLLEAFEEDGVVARNEFVERCYRMAPWVVHDCVKAPMSAGQIQDAIGEAAAILYEVIAEGKFDHTKKVSFAYYYTKRAVPRLYKFINEDKPMKVNNEDYRVLLKLDDACDRFYQENQREANYREQAKMLPSIMIGLGEKPRKSGYDETDVAILRGMRNFDYLNQPVGEDGEEVGDFCAASMRLEDEEAYQKAFDDLRDSVNRCLEVLSERDRAIVLERCLEKGYRATLEEIAEKLGITKSRVEQIFGGNPERSEALAKISKNRDLLDAISRSYSNTKSCGALTY